MNRNRTQHYADEANLQADVMRFMAIVAFCLVAILAIVRNVEPATEPLTNVEPEPPQAPPGSEPPLETARAAKPAPVLHPYNPQAPIPPKLPEPKPELVFSPPTENQSDGHTPELEPVPVITETDTKNEPERQSLSEPELASDSPSELDTGLSLRFASDGDFMRLVSKGTVKLYAISDSGYQSYDVAHRFVPVLAPKHYYEVVAATVPSIVADILQGKTVTWAVGLPPMIEQQISTHIEQASTGELLINRFAEVQHVNVR